MKLYQAGYFRQGRQGSNAGWQIVSPSNGMSQNAIDGFKGIAANLVELKQGGKMPAHNIGIFQYDRFIYLMHVNYTASGDDARGVTFVHGYCFNQNDYYELCCNPEKLFGLSDENFLLEYDPAVRNYDALSDLKFVSQNFEELIEKYQITEQCYREMVLGAISAVEGYAEPLCVKLTAAQEEYKQAYQDILYLIATGMPRHLRLKLTSFSFRGSNALVYLSDQAGSANCVDLDAKAYTGDFSRLGKMEFTKILNFPLAQRQTRDRIYEAIAEFMDATFEGAVKETSCNHIEAGFQGKIKKEQGGIAPDNVMDLLEFALTKAKIAETEVAFDYLADLFEVINNNGIVIENQKLVNRADNKLKNAKSNRYKKELYKYHAKVLLSKNTERAFEELMGWQDNVPELFNGVQNELIASDPRYMIRYQLSYYLPHKITSIDKAIEWIGTHSAIASGDSEFTVVLGLLNAAMQSEMAVADKQERDAIIVKIVKIRGIKQTGFDEQLAALWQATIAKYWETFDLNQFDLKAEKQYKEMQVAEFAQINEGLDYPAARDVQALLDFKENPYSETGRSDLLRMFFRDGTFSSDARKNEIMDVLRKQVIKDLSTETPAGEDVSLMLFYNFEEGNFDVLTWCKVAGKRNASMFDPARVESFVNGGSQLLARGAVREAFITSLEADIKEEKRTRSFGLSKNLMRGLGRMYAALTGKKVASDKDIEEKADFRYALHRAVIGSLVLYSLIFGLCVFGTYGVDNALWVWVGAGVLFVIGILILVMKVVQAGDPGELASGCGLTSPGKAAIFFGIFAVEAVPTIALIFLEDKVSFATILGCVYAVAALAAIVLAAVMVDSPD